jgi:hypothetical protein
MGLPSRTAVDPSLRAGAGPIEPMATCEQICIRSVTPAQRCSNNQFAPLNALVDSRYNMAMDAMIGREREMPHHGRRDDFPDRA